MTNGKKNSLMQNSHCDTCEGMIKRGRESWKTELCFFFFFFFFFLFFYNWKRIWLCVWAVRESNNSNFDATKKQYYFLLFHQKTQLTQLPSFFFSFFFFSFGFFLRLVCQKFPYHMLFFLIFSLFSFFHKMLNWHSSKLNERPRVPTSTRL